MSVGKNLHFETDGKLAEPFLRNSYLAGQVMPEFICNPKFHYHFHSTSPINPESS